MNDCDLFAAFAAPEAGPYTGAPLKRKLERIPGPPSAEEQALGMARQSDPATSDAAAVEHVRSGRSNANENIAVKLVHLYPGQTAVELFNHQGLLGSMDRYEMSKRLADGKKHGRIKHGPKKVCEYHGTEMVTWWPVDQ